jgi:hypothetical protein
MKWVWSFSSRRIPVGGDGGGVSKPKKKQKKNTTTSPSFITSYYA